MTHAGRGRGWGGRGLALLSIVCFGGGGWIRGETAPSARVPPRPSDGVYDDARLFSDEQRRAAAQAIAEARMDGVAVYLAAFTFIAGETIENRAERLKAAWCGEEIGLIVVLDVSANRCTYLSRESDRDWLPSDQLRRIFEEATAASVTKTTAAEQLLSVVEELVPKIHAALGSRREAAHSQGSAREWMVVFLGVVVVSVALVLAAWLGLWLRRRLGATRPEPAFFPTVAVEPRFGGPFAGGVAVELNFGAGVGAGAHSERT